MQINELSYGGIESSIFNITCDRETHYILPEQRKYTKDIPGIDGTIDFGIGGYGVRIIPVDIYFNGDFADLRAFREQIIAWLSNTLGQPKQLAFGDEPGKYYMAKVYAAFNFMNSPDHKIGSIQFECNPPWQYQDGILLTPDQITWNTQDGMDENQYRKEFTANGSIRFTNTGTMPVKPKIKLIGNIPSGLLLGYNGFQWQLNTAIEFDGVMIDCNAETVTKMSDGSNLFGSVDVNKDAYFEIAPGQAEITLTASGTFDFTMLIEFTSQNMG